VDSQRSVAMSSLRAFDNDAREDAAGSLDGLVPVKDGLGGLARRIVSASSACSSPPHELDEEEPWMEMVELVTPRSRTMAASLLLCPPSSWPPPHPPLPDHLPHARLGHPCSSSSCGAEEEGLGMAKRRAMCWDSVVKDATARGPDLVSAAMAARLSPPIAAAALTPARPPARRRRRGPPLAAATSSALASRRGPPPPHHPAPVAVASFTPAWPPARRRRRGPPHAAAASSALASRRGPRPTPRSAAATSRAIPAPGSVVGYFLGFQSGTPFCLTNGSAAAPPVRGKWTMQVGCPVDASGKGTAL
jgi:hypothetical protein